MWGLIRIEAVPAARFCSLGTFFASRSDQPIINRGNDLLPIPKFMLKPIPPFAVDCSTQVQTAGAEEGLATNHVHPRTDYRQKFWDCMTA
jgi:hypothetical protein